MSLGGRSPGETSPGGSEPSGAPARPHDSYIDLVRVTGVLLVVLVHWFLGHVWWSHHRVGIDSIQLEAPSYWMLTWLMAVPTILFAGGYSNYVLLEERARAGTPLTAFYVRRFRRLLAPLLLFLAAWVLIEAALHLWGTGGSGPIRGVSAKGVLPFGSLWFIAVYLMIIVLAPGMLWLHARLGVLCPLALMASAAAVDGLRFLVAVPGVGWLNALVVWLVPYQFGYLYADGSLRALPRMAPLCFFLVGIAGLLLLTSLGNYPRSIGGVTGERISNVKPPTLCIVALSLWQVGLVLALERRMRSLLRRPRLAAGVARLNGVTMSMYLWHMTALLIVLIAVEPLGLAAGSASMASWYLQRPVWLALGALVLAAICRLTKRVDAYR
ncbi:MAG: acyltransferase family protein [Frankiaceae bacterium]